MFDLNMLKNEAKPENTLRIKYTCTNNAMSEVSFLYAKMSVQYTAIFHGCKNDNFQMKIFDIFEKYLRDISQNIDCGYTLEPPQRGGSNEYPLSMFWSKNKKKYVYPSKPHFFYIKVGCKGVFITRICYPDDLVDSHIEVMTLVCHPTSRHNARSLTDKNTIVPNYQ